MGRSTRCRSGIEHLRSQSLCWYDAWCNCHQFRQKNLRGIPRRSKWERIVSRKDSVSKGFFAIGPQTSTNNNRKGANSGWRGKIKQWKNGNMPIKSQIIHNSTVISWRKTNNWIERSNCSKGTRGISMSID